MEKFNLEQKFDAFNDHWHPRIVAELNGQAVKVAKLLGEFMFHHHDNEDELFYVLKGRLKMEFQDRDAVWIEPGEMLVVPRGVEHRPVADEEVYLVMFEPLETLNTGNVVNERTVESPDRL
jgi:mannose-6-phosphate isomerase-like protein (cupin superfamily)